MITIAGVAYPEMADSITPANLLRLPFTPDCYLGYVDGRWADYAQIAAAHGGVPCYGLTVLGSFTIGDGTDTEPGNIDIPGAVRDTQAELARGVDRPIVYCPASWATPVVNAHTAAGIPRSKYRLFTAHYGGPTAAGAPLAGMHICGPATCRYGPGSDGTQWQSLPGYDRSILAPDFITANPHPGPVQPIQLGDTVQAIPFQANLDTAGWMAVDVTLPAGMTRLNITSIVMDVASAYDPQGWTWAEGNPDVDFNQPGAARIIVKGDPGRFFTGRVIVAAAP